MGFRLADALCTSVKHRKPRTTQLAIGFRAHHVTTRLKQSSPLNPADCFEFRSVGANNLSVLPEEIFQNLTSLETL